MSVRKDIKLLIQSNYPIIYLESVDEIYALQQLRQAASELEINYYVWSLTDGLVLGENSEPYYQTNKPDMALKMVQCLICPPEDEEVNYGLYVFKDFEKYLDDPLTLRLMKDIVNQIKSTQNTIALLSPSYHLPKDLQSDTAHVLGSFPNQDEIKKIIEDTVAEITRIKPDVQLSLTTKGFQRLVESLQGLTIQQIRHVMNQCLFADDILDIQDIAVIQEFKKNIFDQEGLLEFYMNKDSAAIAGFPHLKEWIAERKQTFYNTSDASLPAPKGVLLMGVQGCGKSQAIKMIAQQLDLPLYRLDLGRLYSKYIGETEENLRKTLGTIDTISPLCLWIDEIEKGFSTSSGEMDGGVSQRVLATFLTWMQEHRSRCFIAATANDIQRLPPEFLRKGRFDEIFFVDLPDSETRASIFDILLKKRSLSATDFDLPQLATASEGFSGAEIEQVIISALYRASNEKKSLTTQHLLAQIRATKPLSVLKAEDIMALRAWAEERTRLV